MAPHVKRAPELWGAATQALGWEKTPDVLVRNLARLGLDASDLPPLLVYLRHRGEGGLAWPSCETVGAQVGMSPKQVERHRKKWLDLGLCSKGRPRHNARGHRAAPALSFEGLAAEVERLALEERQGDTHVPLEGAKGTRTSLSKGTSTSLSKGTSTSPNTDLGEPDLVETECEHTQGDAHVPLGDERLAPAVLDAFARKAARTYTPATYLPSIRQRIAEHPNLTLSDHQAIITAAFAKPWWKNGTTPSVIYGTAKAFDAAASPPAARTPATGPKSAHPDMDRDVSRVRERDRRRAAAAIAGCRELDEGAEATA